MKRILKKKNDFGKLILPDFKNVLQSYNTSIKCGTVIKTDIDQWNRMDIKKYICTTPNDFFTSVPKPFNGENTVFSNNVGKTGNPHCIIVRFCLYETSRRCKSIDTEKVNYICQELEEVKNRV